MKKLFLLLSFFSLALVAMDAPLTKQQEKKQKKINNLCPAAILEMLPEIAKSKGDKEAVALISPKLSDIHDQAKRIIRILLTSVRLTEKQREIIRLLFQAGVMKVFKPFPGDLLTLDAFRISAESGFLERIKLLYAHTKTDEYDLEQAFIIGAKYNQNAIMGFVYEEMQKNANFIDPEKIEVGSHVSPAEVIAMLPVVAKSKGEETALEWFNTKKEEVAGLRVSAILTLRFLPQAPVRLSRNQLEIIRLLYKSRVNKIDDFDLQAMHTAAESGYLERAKIFIEIFEHCKPPSLGRPLYDAVKFGHINMVNFLLQVIEERKESVNKDNLNNAFLCAVSQNNMEIVKRFLKVCPSLASLACEKKYLCYFRSLGLVDATPLMIASDNGSKQAVQLLLSCGANKNIRRNDNKKIAYDYAQTEVLKALLKPRFLH